MGQCRGGSNQVVRSGSVGGGISAVDVIIKKQHLHQQARASAQLLLGNGVKTWGENTVPTIMLSQSGEACQLIRVAPEEDPTVVRKIISDSGANLGLISFTTANALGLAIEVLEQPFRIQFGAKDARPQVAHYVDGGAIIGRLYVLDGAAMSLSSVVMFTRNGLDVLYSGTKVAVIEDGQEVLRGTMNSTTKLYEFDLANLLSFSRNWQPRSQRPAAASIFPEPADHLGALPTAPAGMGAMTNEVEAVAALDRWDPAYVRNRQAISLGQCDMFCGACFVAEVDGWACTGCCLAHSEPVVCTACAAGITQDGPYQWEWSSSGFATRILSAQGFEGKGLGRDGQGRSTTRPPSTPRDPHHPRHGIGFPAAPVVSVGGAFAFGALVSSSDTRLSAVLIRLVREAHELSGHLAPSSLANAIRDGVIRNVPEKLTPELIAKVNRVEQCVVCEAARRTHEDTPQGSGSLPPAAGSVFSGDSLGPMRVPTPEGFRYISLWKCAATGCLIPQLTKSTGDDVYGSLRNLLELNDHLGHQVKWLRVDAGSSEGSKQFAATAAGYKAYVTYCAAERQRANPVERQVHTIWRQVQALLAASPWVSASQWGSCFLHVVYMRNCVSNTRSRAMGDGDKSPMQLFYGVEPDFDKWQVWGSIVTWPKTGVIDKLTLRNKVGVWMGRTVSGMDLVYEAGSQWPVIRAGVQKLHLLPGHIPTTKELVVLMSHNSDPMAEGELDIVAQGDEVFSVRSFLIRQQRLRGQLEQQDVGEERATPRRGEVGNIMDLGMNGLAGLRQPEPVAARTRAAVREGLALENGQPIVIVDGPAGTEVSQRGQDVPEQSSAALLPDAMLPPATLTAPALPMQPAADLPNDVVDEGALDANVIPVYWAAMTSLAVPPDQGGREDGEPRRHGCSDTCLALIQDGISDLAQLLRADDAHDDPSVQHWGLLAQAASIHFDDEAHRRSKEASREKARTDSPRWEKAVAPDNPDRESWWEANEKEFTDLQRRHQIRQVDLLLEAMPALHLFIGIVICCTTKYKADGLFLRHKVRCAVRGDLDATVFAKDDTYAPSAKWTSYFLFVALAALFGWEISSIDVTAAFGYNPYNRPEKMYFRTEGSMNRDGVPRIYEVLCLIYGLKEASRAFYDLMSAWLVSQGWTLGQFDPCVFRRGTLRALISTDDVLFSNEPNEGSRQELARARDQFAKRFDITIDAVGDGYLGVFINQQVGYIGLSMPGKLEKLKELTFPALEDGVYPDELAILEPSMPTWSEEASDLTPPCEAKIFRSIVGLILFIAKVRHDALLMLSFLSGRMHRATTLDLEAAMHLSAYLLYTRRVELRFYRGTKEARDQLTIMGAADAAFRTHTHSSQSHYGRGFKVITNLDEGMQCGSGFFCGKSQSSQGLVPFTIADAETGSAVEAVKDMIYFKGLIEEDFGLSMGGRPMILEEDNIATTQVASHLTSKNSHMKQSSHMAAFLRSAAAMGFYKMAIVGTAQQTVNSLTKGLGATANARDLPLVQGRSAITDAIREMATLRLNRRRPLTAVSSGYDGVAGAVCAAAVSLHDDMTGYDFVVREAQLEDTLAEILGELTLLARAANTVAEDEVSMALTLEGYDEERTRADYLRQEIQIGLGKATAVELEPVEHRASLRQFQEVAEAHIATRAHDSPHWNWKQPGGQMPNWYKVERHQRDSVLTELWVYAEPEDRGEGSVPTRHLLRMAVPGRGSTRGSRGGSGIPRRVTWVGLAGSIAMSTTGMCGLQGATNPAGTMTDPDLEGVDMSLATVQGLLDAAARAQTVRDCKRRREGGDDLGTASTALRCASHDAVTTALTTSSGAVASTTMRDNHVHTRSTVSNHKRNYKRSKKQMRNKKGKGGEKGGDKDGGTHVERTSVHGMP